MKTLFLIRHAKSDLAEDGLKDHERPLNSRGYRVAQKMAMYLKENGISFERIFSSTALRASTTAKFIAERIDNEYVLEEVADLYLAPARQLMNFVNELSDELQTVAIVGHNPDLTYFAEYLTNEAIENLSTCAIVEIKLEIDSWKEVSQHMGKFIRILDPEELGM